MTEFGEKAPAFLPYWQNVAGLFYGVVFFSTGAAAAEPNYRGLSFPHRRPEPRATLSSVPQPRLSVTCLAIASALLLEVMLSKQLPGLIAMQRQC